MKKHSFSLTVVGLFLLTACSSGGPTGASISDVYVPEDISSAVPDWLELGTDVLCDPACQFKECGPDGCGGVCGKCLSGEKCGADFQCVECQASCAGKNCGDDGCGSSCGKCGDGEHCAPDFECRPGACSPGQSKCDEDGKVTFCLGDGSDWSYPVPCPQGEKCLDGQCVPEIQACNPGEVKCDGQGFQTCLADGSGWSETVACPEGTQCTGGKCKQVTVEVTCAQVLECMMQTKCGDPQPACMADCFKNASEQVVASATAVYTCIFGNCNKWGPTEGCFQMERISTCAAVVGACKNQCTPSCNGAECGSDGCGGSCGQCQPGFQCSGGHCIKDCTPDCTGKECGGDGCGGQCGTCQAGFSCSGGHCIKDCTPNCAGKECGGDGCGSSCGQCGPGAKCNGGKCESSDPCNGITYEGCCDGQILKYCAEGKVVTENCASKPQCGWKANQKYYDCGTSGNADPDGVYPKTCPGSSCTPNCAGKQCGGDGCGGSCGNCLQGQYCSNGTCLPEAGGDSCNAVVECVFGCQTFQCYNNCKSTGDAQAQQIFGALETCILQHCGFEFSGQCLWDAVSGPCETQFDACQDDQ